MQVGRTRPAAPKPVARKRAARTRRRSDGLMRAVGVMGREEAQLKNLARSISADAAHEKTRAVPPGCMRCYDVYRKPFRWTICIENLLDGLFAPKIL